MARFYASIHGQAPSTATRRGSKSSGISGHIRGWDSGVRVEGSYDPDTDTDEFRVYATAGSNGYGADRLIATIVDGAIRAGGEVAA